MGQVVQPAEEMCDIVVVQADLRRRQGHDLFYGIAGALGLDVEPPDGVDFVAEEVDPVRSLGVYREEIDDAAASGELSGQDHQIGRLVAGGGQALEQTRERYPFADCERYSACQIAFGTIHFRQQVARRGNDYGWLSAKERTQGHGPPPARVGRSLDWLVGPSVVGRQLVDFKSSDGEVADLGGNLGGPWL